MRHAKYAKAAVAVLIAALTALYAAVTDDHVTTQKWITIALAGAGALGVYLVPNRAPAAPEPPRETS